MKKLKKILSITMLYIIIMLSTANCVFAVNFADYLDDPEYNEEFLEWQKLSEEEKKAVLEPTAFVIPKTKVVSTNPINIADALSATYESKYDLRTIISDNLSIRNQMQTGSCWAFAGLSSLETNLAMSDYKESKDASTIYDYSERHMVYATSRTFLDNKINENGFGREANNGGNFFIANAYLNNGTGAILEEDMPFENNEDKIDISEIQNKKVQTQVYDTVFFPFYLGNEDTEELRNEMKNYIKNYGGLTAGIHGAQRNTEYYNNETGAIYCDNKEKCPMNHNVTIIGWDDNYSIDNFNENHKPKNPGAWIIRNSWGDKYEISMETMKANVFRVFEKECKENGWDTPEKIPDEVALDIFERSGYEVKDGKAYDKIGDNGFMYVSYEDVQIYSTLNGITKSDNTLNYENIYQYNFYGMSDVISYTLPKVYVANVFDKSGEGTEYVNQISLYTSETTKCKVYINPNGSDKSLEAVKPVELKDGSSKTVEAGYHTFEFLNPVEIAGNQFVVLVELEGTQGNNFSVPIEYPIKDTFFANVEVETNKTFWTIPGEIEKNVWVDFGKLSELKSGFSNCDSTIKAFTVSKLDEPVLESIEITTPPAKTSYIAGQKFDPTGMVVTAKYNDGKSEEIKDYKIEDGDNLSLGQTSVKFTYQGKSVEQEIKVEEKNIEKIEIINLPNKVEYIQNKEELDLTGGKIKATYTDESTEEVSMTSTLVTSSGFNNKVLGTSTVTITYLEKTTSFDVKIVEQKEEKPEKVDPENSEFTSMKSNVSNVKAYYFTDKTKQQYMTMDVQLTNITRSTKNDSMTYYYYLSSSPNTKNITNWVKIGENQDSNDRLKFTINTKDLSNFNEVSQAKNLYLYIKEVAKKDSNEKSLVTSAVALVYSQKPEIYLDGVKQQENNNNNNNNDDKKNNNTNNDDKKQNNNNNNSNKNTQSYVNSSKDDNTVADKVLPKAGTTFLFITIFTITILGIIMYIKYERIDK